LDAQARIINRIADFLVSIISSLHHLQIIPKSHYGDSFLTHHQKLPVYLFAAQCGIETGSRILLGNPDHHAAISFFFHCLGEALTKALPMPR